MARPKTPSDPPRRAKLFWNGRSQALRLPKEFRFAGEEVLLRRDGDVVTIEPLPRRSWPEGFFARLSARARAFKDFEVPAPLPAGGTDVSFDER